MRNILLPILLFLLLAANANAATVTCSIDATTGDYASVTAWEAASYGTIGAGCDGNCASGDDCVGEVTGIVPETGVVTLNDTTPGATGSITLTAAAGAKHTGQAGTGAEISFTHNREFSFKEHTNPISFDSLGNLTARTGKSHSEGIN